MRRHYLFVLLLIAVLGNSAARADDAVEPAALRHVSAESGDFFYLFVPDTLPQLKTLLNHRGLRRVLTQGSLTDFFADLPDSPSSLDPLDAWRALEDGGKRFVPTEVAVALPQQSVDTIDRLVRIGMLGTLCAAAKEAGGVSQTRDLPKLQDELLKTLKGAGIPRMTVWVRLRDEDDATLVRAAAQLQVTLLAAEVGLDVLDAKSGFGLRGKLGDAIEDLLLDVMLEEFGVVADEDDPKLPAFRKVIKDLTAEVWFEQFGDGLRLTVGPRDKAPATGTAKKLGPLFRTGPQEILFSHTDFRRGKAMMAGWVKLWQQWEKTPAGKLVAQWDTDQFLRDIRLFAQDAATTADSTTVRVWADRGTVRANLRSLGAAPAKKLRGTTILSLVPADIEAVSLTSISNLAHVVSNFVYQFEGRLDTRGLQYNLAGRADQAEQTDAIAQQYYTHFATFRELVHERFREVVDGPSAVLVTSSGRIDAFRISYVEDGRKNVRLRNLPMFEMALVGQIKNKDQWDAFAAQFYRSFVEGIFATAEKKLPRDASLIRPRDLGLGVPTYALSGEWITTISGDARVELSVEGDFHPHYFVKDGHVVWSTSPKLSRRMLAAGGSRHLKLPPQPWYARTVSFGRIPGRTVGNYMTYVFRWARAVLKETGDPFALEAFESVIQLAEGVSEVCQLVDHVEWTTAEKPNVQHTDLRVRFTANEAK